MRVFTKRIYIKRRAELVKKFELDEKKKIEDLSLGNLKKSRNYFSIYA